MENRSFKQIGVWMDHSKALIVGHDNGSATLLETVDSPYERIIREPGEGDDKTRFTGNSEHSSNNEYRKNNTSQNELNEYFKMLEGKVKMYDDILLFGPSTAKEQFRNRLRENKSFDGKWLSVQPADKMTENQLLAFVRDFYKG